MQVRRFAANEEQGGIVCWVSDAARHLLIGDDGYGIYAGRGKVDEPIFSDNR